MKKFLFAAILILPIAAFISCGGQGSDENYLRFAWWGNTVRDERTAGAVRLFMERNPGVTIEPETTEWGGYWARIATLAAAGNLPDVMQQDLAYIVQYDNQNLLEDLEPFSRNGAIDLGYWPEAGLSPGRLNGKLAGLVLGTNAQGLGVDPAVLERSGITIDDENWTWADYEKIAVQIFERTGVQTAPYVANMEHTTRQFGDFGIYYMDGMSLGIANNPQALDAYRSTLEMDLRLRENGALYDPENSAPFLLAVAMEEQSLSTGRTWNAAYNSNQHIAMQNAADRPLQFVMLPTVEGQRPPFGNYLRASMFVSLLSTSRNKDMAAKFIDFFVNDIEANRILLAERGIPLPSNVREDLYGIVDGYNRYLFDYITRIIPFTSPANPPLPSRAGEVDDEIRRVVLQILTNRIDIDAGLDQITQTSAEILSR